MVMIYTVTNLYGDVVPITVAENIAAKGGPDIHPVRHGIIAIFADLRGSSRIMVCLCEFGAISGWFRGRVVPDPSARSRHLSMQGRLH